MTRKELASKIQSLERRNKLQIFIGLILIGLWLISGAVLDNFMHWGGSQTFRYAYGILGIIIFFAIIFGTVIVFDGLMELFLMPLEEKGYFNWAASIDEYS